MKLPTTAALAALLLAAPSLTLADDVATCRGKNRDAANAIELLCSRPNLLAGGKYRMSTYADNIHSSVAIMARQGEGCNPPQYVPPYWCRRQFYGICAAGKGGYGYGYFGTEHCQLWTIYKTSDKNRGRPN